MKCGNEKAQLCITVLVSTLHGTSCTLAPTSEHTQWWSIHFLRDGGSMSLGVREPPGNQLNQNNEEGFILQVLPSQPHHLPLLSSMSVVLHFQQNLGIKKREKDW